MLDVYLALLPTYALVTIINLYYLKQSLNDHAIATAHTHHQLPTEPNELENTERSQFKACVTHLLKNFTLLEPCRVGRGKYKLSLLLTVSLVSIATFYINSPFSFVFLGVVVYSGYFLMALGSGKGEGEQKSQKQKYVQIAYAVTSVIINFTLIALLYKNYRNSLLRQFVTNCAINLAIDNFAVRPIALLLISLPLSRSSAVMGFIDSQEREVRVIEAFEKGSGKQLLQKPIGKMFSPTKIAKSVPLNMEIEPVPFLEPEQSDSSRWHRTLLTLKESAAQERLEKSLYILQQILGEETREKCFTLLRKITREESVERCLSILSAMVREEREEKSGYYLQQLKKHATPFKRHQHQEDLSMNSLFNSNNKEQETPRARHIELDESLHTSQHQIEITNEIPIQNKASTIEIDLPMPYMEHKPASDNVVMINPSRQEPQENEEDYVSLEQGRKITEESIEEQHLNFNKKETIELRQQINPLKIIVHESSGPSSRNEPLRICLNEAHMNGQDEEDQQQIESDRYRRRRSTINVQETSSKNTMGALQVKLSNRNQLEEIEEIDLNSPERRRKMAMKEEEASRVQVGKKKNKKRLSIDPRQRVIRFTTGQPYLQYLPNMLTSKDKKKKSQQFNKKELVIDSRMANSSKKQKKKEINFENNENLVPTFRIEEA